MPKLLKYHMKGGGRSLGTPKSDYLICARPLSVIGLRHPECHIYGKGWQKRLFRKPSPKAMEWHIFVRKAPLTMFRFQIITYHCYHLQHYLLSAIYYLLSTICSGSSSSSWSRWWECRCTVYQVPMSPLVLPPGGKNHLNHPPPPHLTSP